MLVFRSPTRHLCSIHRRLWYTGCHTAIDSGRRSREIDGFVLLRAARRCKDGFAVNTRLWASFMFHRGHDGRSSHAQEKEKHAYFYKVARSISSGDQHGRRG
jgi:hypothetical protein